MGLGADKQGPERKPCGRPVAPVLRGVVVLNGSFAIAMIGSTLHHRREVALALLTSFG